MDSAALSLNSSRVSASVCGKGCSALLAAAASFFRSPLTVPSPERTRRIASLNWSGFR